MAKLIQLDEAAILLGVTPEALNDMRSRNEIYGYRDGSTWKFKLDELERIKAEKGLGGSAGDEPLDLGLGDLDDNLLDADDSLKLDLGEDDSLKLDLGEEVDVIDLPSGDDSDSILVSEEELGKSDENTASTIIGEADELLPDSGVSDALTGESDLELTLDSSDIASSSDASHSDVLSAATDQPPTASDTANLAALDESGELKLEGDDSGSLDLGLEDAVSGGSRIDISDDAKASSSGFGSAIDLDLDDDDLVLGSGSGSDVTSGAGDSGINLSNPSDSGLSLEEPLELSAGGSSVESLELGEDDMLEDLDGALIADDEGDADDFMLTPVEDSLDEESDSGSQVIALDSSELSEGDAVDMLDEAGPILEEDTEFDADVGFDAGITAGATTAGLAATGPVDEEASYSVWNVLSLFCIVALLGFVGILMLDVINNIWSWDGGFAFNSKIMDAILSMMPGD